MKKRFALLMVAVMTLSLVACGGNDTTTDTQADTNVEAEVNTEEDTTTEADTSTEAEVTTEDAVETVSNVPVFTWDWDKLVFTFNEDGTFKMELPEYQITEEGTWAIADGVLTVTSPAGKTYSSTIEEDVCKLNYVADASEQLVAQLYTSDYGFLTAGATASAGVPAFTWDWDKLVFTFNEDGTCTMELPEYQIAEECTWVANGDGTYTVTSPAGKEYTSYTGEDGLVHLDYVADASEQLVAQLYIK